MKKFWEMIVGVLSFHYMDVVGLLSGLYVLESSKNDQAIFATLTDPKLYIILFLILVLLRSWAWLFVYRGEMPYLKSSLLKVLNDYIRVLLVAWCFIGSYLFMTTILF